MELSKRLYTVASAVTAGNRLADVGTDHGYVPIDLVGRGICPSALAMDINKGPLERAREHIEEQGLSRRIGTRLSDGMARLEKGEVDSVVIAGMGGDLMARILKAREDLLADGLELILQPQSEWWKVRRSLHAMHYQILGEWFLKEDGKYYVVMKACPGEESYEEEWEYAYGRILDQEGWPVLEEYLTREIGKREKISQELKKKNPCRNEQRLLELEHEMILMKERLRAGR